MKSILLIIILILSYQTPAQTSTVHSDVIKLNSIREIKAVLKSLERSQLTTYITKYVCDSLSFIQKYPNKKIPIFSFDNVSYLPFNFSNIDSSEVMLKPYIKHFNTRSPIIRSGIKCLIPTDKVETVLDSLLTTYPNLSINILNAYECGEAVSGYDIVVTYIDSSKNLQLNCRDRVWHSIFNAEIIGDIDISNDTIHITTKINYPNVGLEALGMAGGIIEFSVPSNKFILNLDNELFQIEIDKKDITIISQQVSDNIISIKKRD